MLKKEQPADQILYLAFPKPGSVLILVNQLCGIKKCTHNMTSPPLLLNPWPCLNNSLLLAFHTIFGL